MPALTKPAPLPPLERSCGSWVIVDRLTGRAALETFSRRVAEAINQSHYRVVTAMQWLASLNRKPSP